MIVVLKVQDVFVNFVIYENLLLIVEYFLDLILLRLGCLILFAELKFDLFFSFANLGFLDGENHLLSSLIKLRKKFLPLYVVFVRSF